MKSQSEKQAKPSAREKVDAALAQIEGHVQQLTREASAPTREQGDTFAIYQLKDGPEMVDCRFRSYSSLQRAGLAVDRQNYSLVYTASLDSQSAPAEMLEDIYLTFNINHPADFTGHSLSVSDVVVLTRNGSETAYYCDSVGFTPVPEFLASNPAHARESPAKAAERPPEQHSNRLDDTQRQEPKQQRKSRGMER